MMMIDHCPKEVRDSVLCCKVFVLQIDFGTKIKKKLLFTQQKLYLFMIKKIICLKYSKLNLLSGCCVIAFLCAVPTGLHAALRKI